MKELKQLTPLIATHPGEVLFDELEARGISQTDFAQQIGLKKSQLNEIIKGKRNVNAELALLFEKVLNINADYWLELQKNYDLDVARIEHKNQHRLEAIEQWNLIKDKIPVAFFKKEKIITGDPVNDIPTLKALYGVEHLDGFANIFAQPNYIHFRKSSTLQIDPVNLIGWIKLVQYKATKQNVEPFNYKQKKELIKALKRIITKNKKTLERVQNLLKEFGIKLIYQQKPPKAPIDGISFWSNQNPAIGISLRYKRLDNFAFTLFHELGHIYEHLLNNNSAEFIDLDYKVQSNAYKKDPKEKEANLFAEQQLIDKDAWKSFYKKNDNYSDEEIIAFAKANKIHPCIVRGKISFKRNNYRIRSDIDFSIY